jgi:hypothetical protein
MMDADVAKHASGATDAQLRYATWLHWAGLLSLAALIGTFALYVTGVIEPLTPLEELAESWRLPADELLRRTGRQTGWDWVQWLHKGDILNLSGIALLSGCSVLPLLAIVPNYLRQRQRLFAALCLLHIALLGLAASGLLSIGH